MIFISYSSAQREIALALQAELASRQRQTWLDVGKFPVGEEFVKQIASGLRAATAVVNVDSPEARASYWVSREIQVSERLRRHGLITHLLRLSSDAEPPSTVSFDQSFLSIAETVEFIERAVSREHTVASADGNQVTLRELSGREVPRYWYGFADVLAELDRWQDGGSLGCWISGAPGSGKSALARVWVAANELLGYRDDRLLEIMFWSLGPLSGRVNASAVNDEITKALDQHSGRRGLLCLDGLDEVDWSPDDVANVFSAAFTTKQKVLVTSREVPSAFAEEFEHLELRPLGDRELGHFVRNLSLDQAVEQGIFARAQGSPLLAAFVRDGLRDGRITIHDLARAPREGVKE